MSKFAIQTILGVMLAESLLAAVISPSRASELRIEQERPIAFGRIRSNSNEIIRVTIPSHDDDPTSSRWSIGHGLSHRARFVVEGQPGEQFLVYLPEAVDGEGWRLESFTSYPEGFGELDSSGRAVVLVGATLRVKSGARKAIRARFRVRVEPAFTEKRSNP